MFALGRAPNCCQIKKTGLDNNNNNINNNHITLFAKMSRRFAKILRTTFATTLSHHCIMKTTDYFVYTTNTICIEFHSQQFPHMAHNISTIVQPQHSHNKIIFSSANSLTQILPLPKSLPRLP